MCELFDQYTRRGRQEGLSEGMQKGLSQGRQEGLSEGMQKGLSQGRQEGLSEGMQKGLNQGLRIGLSDGLQKGLQALISTCRELGVPFEETAARVKEKFSLGEEDTRKNMQLYW